MKKSLLFLSLFTLIAFSACREDGVTTQTVTGDIPDPTVITPTLSIVSPPSTPENVLADASIKGLGSSFEINPDGSVTIPASELDPAGTRITVTKPGHWPEHRLLTPAGDGELREVFEMEPKVKAGEINPAAGGTISLGENFSVKLEPNTIVTTADGTPYTGEVEVYVNHDAPEDANEMLNSASNFLAMTASGETAVLESYGMMDIALEAPDGSPLVLDGSTPAEVRIPIKAATADDAPEEVPFWVLDPDGFWLEDGVARLAPGCYVVYITTSNTHNVDVPHPVTRICGRLVDPIGLPLTHTPFLASLDGGMSVSGSRVDCDGYFCINVAANVPLLLKIIDPCTEELSLVAIDPVDPNTSRDLGEIEIDLTNPVFLATVRDCDGGALANYADTEIWVGGKGGNDGEYFAPRTDGQTVINLIDCSGDDLLIQAFTSDYKAASRVIRRTAEEEMPTEFIVCGELQQDEVLELTIGGIDIPLTEVAPIYWPDNEEFDWLVRATGVFRGEEYSLFLRFADPGEGRLTDEQSMAAVYRLLPGQELGEGKVYVNPQQNLGLNEISVSNEGGTFEGTFNTKMNLQNDGTSTVEQTDLDVTVTFRLNI